MTLRRVFLILLAAATCFYYGDSIYRNLTGPTGLARFYASEVYPAVSDGSLVVQRINDTDVFGATTPAHESGLQVGDRIVTIHDSLGQGGAFQGDFELGNILRRIVPEEPLLLGVSRLNPAGEEKRLDLILPPIRPTRPLRQVFLGLYFMMLPLLSVITALFVGFARPNNDHAFLSCLLFLGFATIFGAPDMTAQPGIRGFLIVYRLSLNIFLVYAFMRFFLVFPSRSFIERRVPWVKHVLLAMTFAILGAELFFTFVRGFSYAFFSEMASFATTYSLISVVTYLLMFLLGLASLAGNLIQTTSKDERRRLTILLLGATIGLIPPLFYFYAMQILGVGYTITGVVFFLSLFALFPLSFVYVVLKHRVFGIRLILRRGLQYALVSRGFLVFEGLLIFLLLDFVAAPIFAASLPEAGPRLTAFVTALATVGLVLGLRRVNRRIMPAIDRRFFRSAYDARRILTNLGQAVRHRADTPEELVQTVVQEIMAALQPRQVAVFLRSKEIRALVSLGGEEGRASLSSRVPVSDDAFHCYWFCRRLGRQQSSFLSGKGKGMTLSGNALLAKALSESAGDDPEPLDVYLDDPKSWTCPLTDADADEEDRQERELLETLGTQLVVPLATKDRFLGFLSLSGKMSEEPYSREDKDLVLAAVQQTAIALDYAQLIGRTAEQAKVMRDVEIATEVQRKLLPQIRPEVPRLECFGLCRPARGVGGDCYDFRLLDAGRLAVALGDISGKGVSAALLMANLQATLRSQAPLRGDRVDELAEAVNGLLCESTGANKFATFFYGVFDAEARRLSYVNAGHNPPLLLRRQEEHGGERAARWLKSTGTLLGVFPEATFGRKELPILPGDLLILYSDGVTEAMTPAHEEYGEERLLETARSGASGSAEEICLRILDDVTDFAAGEPQSDDITLVVMKGVED